MHVANSYSQPPNLRLLHRGKVRDVFEIDHETLLLVATDRLSAFDCVLPTRIPGKGIVLTQLSAFWFDLLRDESPNHLVATDIGVMPDVVPRLDSLKNRSSLVRRTEVFPVECVVRGYLEGSGWKEYKEAGSVCGHRLPQGLRQCDRLDEPLFTPATKAATGHDENISFDRFTEIVGEETAFTLRDRSLRIYENASSFAAARGIIIADTKFEFGLDSDGNILLIDEVLTPDSSRFWDAAAYKPGGAQPSYDKQFVREYLETLDWNKKPPAPALSSEIVAATLARYHCAYELLTGRQLPDFFE